jgi:hypothetical protein
MLEALHQEYGPKKESHLALAKRVRLNYIEFYNFDASTQLDEAENSLQLFCIALMRVFGVGLGEALGLLVCRFKYFKRLVVEGSRRDDFESVRRLYAQITEVWPVLEELASGSEGDLCKILEGLCEGVLSESLDIIHATLNLLSFVKLEEWFLNYGYFKLLSSPYIQCFYFTIERLSPHY